MRPLLFLLVAAVALYLLYLGVKRFHRDSIGLMYQVAGTAGPSVVPLLPGWRQVWLRKRGQWALNYLERTGSRGLDLEICAEAVSYLHDLQSRRRT